MTPVSRIIAGSVLSDADRDRHPNRHARRIDGLAVAARRVAVAELTEPARPPTFERAARRDQRKRRRLTDSAGDVADSADIERRRAVAVTGRVQPQQRTVRSGVTAHRVLFTGCNRERAGREPENLRRCDAVVEGADAELPVAVHAPTPKAPAAGDRARVVAAQR